MGNRLGDAFRGSADPLVVPALDRVMVFAAVVVDGFRNDLVLASDDMVSTGILIDFFFFSQGIE